MPQKTICSATNSLTEGQVKTFKYADGTDYEIELLFIDDSKAKFEINGETTSLIASGNRYIMADGEEFIVDTVSGNSASFCINGGSGDIGDIIVKGLPPFTAAVYDKAPASDVIIISDVAIALKGDGYEVPIGTSKLFSEVNALSLDNKVTLAVYLGEAVIVVGEHSPASHVNFAVDIEEILSKKDIIPQTILSSEVQITDLLDLFEGELDDKEIEISEEDEEESIIPLTPIKVEPNECETSADCNDDNACTSDLCSGIPKKCSYIEVSLGCNYNGNCIPIGVRADNNYCDIDRIIKSQLRAGEECNNNYECSTNICVNSECISSSFIQRIINWFSGLFGR